MAIERTGTAIAIQPTYYSNDGQGNASIEVPADCTMIIATWVATWASAYPKPVNAFKLGTTDFTQIDAIGKFTDGSGDTNQTHNIFLEILCNPSTGTQTLYWDIASTVHPYYGVVILVSFYKGVDTSDPIVDYAHSATACDLSGMSYSTGNMMIGVTMSWNYNPNMVPSGSGQTQDVESAANRTSPTWGGMAHKLSTGSFDTTNTSEPAAMAVIIRDYVPSTNALCEAGVGVSVVAGGILEVSIVEGLSEAGVGVSAVITALNVTRFLRENADRAIYEYYATITGSGDGETDYPLPALRSFQARMRQGEPTYLGLVLNWSAAVLGAIQARTNGQIFIDMAAIVNGEEVLREELIRVNYDSVRYNRGAENGSITVTGYITQTWGTPAVNVVGAVTESMQADGRLMIRCARPDFYLRPGSVAHYGASQFDVGMVVLAMSPQGQSMDIQEA